MLTEEAQTITPKFCVADFVKAAKEFGCFSFDIEHNPNISWREDGFKIHGMSVCTDQVVHYLTDHSDIQEVCKQLFEDPKVEAVAHNGKYDLICLKRSGLIEDYPKNFIDTMCVMNLLDDNLSEHELGLKSLIPRIYGKEMVDFKTASSEGLDSDKFHEYAKEDAYWEFKLWVDHKPQLQQQNLYNYLTRIMMPALITFCDVELAGVGWNTGHAIWCYNEFSKTRDKLTKRIYETIGKIDIASSQQISKRLFEDLGYSTKYTEKGKNGFYCADYDVLDKMSYKYPVCRDICLVRSCDKMISTYLTNLTRQHSENFDGRVRGSFWLTSQTGRTRCSDDNLQNVPVHYNMHEELRHINLRKCFVPRNGFKLIVGDFSQIELRFFGQIAKERTFMSYFRKWECTECNSSGESDVILHSCPNCGVKENEGSIKGSCKGFWHGKDLHYNTAHKISVLDGDRGAAKIANFSIIYNILARTLHARNPELSESKWQAVIDEFMSEYKDVRTFHAAKERELKSLGKTRDLFGRIRRFTKKSLREHFKHCLNAIINFPVQSSATALSLIVMAAARRHFLKTGQWMNDVFIVNMVHDELVFEVREDLAEELLPVIRDIMEKSLKFDVPIRADLHIVESWGHSK
jgi:DNA polymerase-1